MNINPTQETFGASSDRNKNVALDADYLSTLGFDADLIGKGKFAQFSYVTNKSLDVYVQDQTTPSIELYIHTTVVETTLAAPTIVDGDVITLASTDGISADMIISILDDDTQCQTFVKSVSGNDVTVLIPCDRVLGTGTKVRAGWHNLNLDGSTTPVIAYVEAPNNKKYDLYTLNVTLITATTPTMDKFGDLLALQNGILFRVVDGDYKNIALIRRNADFFSIGASISMEDKVPAGTGCIFIRKNYNEVCGVARRLNGFENEQYQMLIRDDLSGLAEMYVTITGHTVED